MGFHLLDTLTMLPRTVLTAAALLLCPGLLNLQGRGPLGLVVVEAVTQADLYRLMDDLFGTYKPEVRPTTAGEATYVYVGLYLLSIQNLDEKSQVLESVIVVDTQWIDDYLSWNESNYGNVNSFMYPQKKIWLPDVVIENSVESQRQLGYDENVVVIDHGTTVLCCLPDHHR